jgi:hypothetical protein
VGAISIPVRDQGWRRHPRLRPTLPARRLPPRRSRQEIEKDYYQDWERTTLLAEEERDRPMTVVTFLTFLPTWLQFYAVPGPLRFVAHLLARWAAAAAHRVHKRVVVQGERPLN